MKLTLRLEYACVVLPVEEQLLQKFTPTSIRVDAARVQYLFCSVYVFNLFLQVIQLQELLNFRFTNLLDFPSKLPFKILTARHERVVCFAW